MLKDPGVENDKQSLACALQIEEAHGRPA